MTTFIADLVSEVVGWSPAILLVWLLGGWAWVPALWRWWRS